MRQIISHVKKSIIPSQTLIKSKDHIANTAFELVATETKKFSEIVGVEFGGSYAKETWVGREADVDIFIRFKESTSDKKFEDISKKIGFVALKKFEPYVRYSEHPYVEANIMKTKVNVVPCYDVKIGNWKSSADRSPFHTKYMQEMLTQEMKNEVRILKTFLKSIGIYGAEIAKQGFSGYVSEVLILNYKTFENVVEVISKIKEGQVIGKTSKKFDTPIIIMDPIDSNRNLAAAISSQNIGKFVLACRAFQAKPTAEFFKPKKTRAATLENVMIVKFNFKNRSPDIIWGQIKRAASSLSTQLKIGGFNVLRSTAFTDEKNEAYLFFLLESPLIPKKYVKKGPDYFREEDVRSFVKKNIVNSEIMWIDNDSKIVSLERRKHYDAVKYLRDFVKNNLDVGIPKGLQNDLRKGFDVILGGKNLEKSIKEAVSELVSTNEKIFYSN